MAKPPYESDSVLEAEYRLGQCLVALGSGAGPIRVRRAAVRWFLTTLRKPFEEQAKNHPCHWLDLHDYTEDAPFPKSEYLNDATQITDLCRAVGRLAAQKATERGSFAISEDDLEFAFNKVKGVLPGESIRGAYCTNGGRG